MLFRSNIAPPISNKQKKSRGSSIGATNLAAATHDNDTDSILDQDDDDHVIAARDIRFAHNAAAGRRFASLSRAPAVGGMPPAVSAVAAGGTCHLPTPCGTDAKCPNVPQTLAGLARGRL